MPFFQFSHYKSMETLSWLTRLCQNETSVHMHSQDIKIIKLLISVYSFLLEYILLSLRTKIN